MPCDVSVIIVNLNGCALLQDCLNSIYHHTHAVSYEIIIVDNHSSDGSVAMVKEHFPQVRLIENTENTRYAIANNQGLDMAQGRYVLYLNTDTKLLGNVIKELADFLDQTPDAGGVGGQLINADGSRQDSCFRFPSAVNLFYLNTFARFYWKSSLAANYLFDHQSVAQEVDFLVGACYLVRRDILQQCGGMDADYYLYGEDSDLCYRIRKAGWKNYYLPESEKVVHYGGATSVDFFDNDQRARNLQGWKARFQFVKKHYSRWRKATITLAMGASLKVNVLLYALAALKRRNWQYFRTHFDLYWEITREVGGVW
jgi:GT2 family glycosyltransferase